MSTLSEILRNAPPPPPIRRVSVNDVRKLSPETRAKLLDMHVQFADPLNRPLGSAQ